MAGRKDITGQVFGRLTAVKPSYINARRSVVWRCRCECGGETEVPVNYLVRGNTRSCGCLAVEMKPTYRRKHGKSQTDMYFAWKTMHRRCTDPKHPRWERYGGRGITVCDRWKSYENFLADMGERPEGTSIDRIDLDGPYAPENCRWATPKEQARNKSNSRFVEWDGRRQTIAAWAEEQGIGESTLRARLRLKPLHIAMTMGAPR
jgi:hypothetical protein